MSEGERYLDREAIVVRSRDVGEADRLVWIVTREEGRTQVLARGVRRPRARLGGSIQPLSLVRLTLYDGRRLSITGASVERAWRRWKETYEGTVAGAFMAELLFLASPEGSEAEAPFSLAREAFDRGEEGSDVIPTALAFARDLLSGAGWGIDYGVCAVCGRPLRGDAYVHPHLGAVTHPGCRREGYALDGATLESLRGGEVTGANQGRLLEALLMLWQHHLEGPLRTAPGIRRAIRGG